MVTELKFKTLEPYMSDEQLYMHYEMHHKNYDKNIKNILNSDSYDLNNILKTADQNSKLYNNAAQVFNHNLFWNSIKLNTLTEEKQDNYINLIEKIKIEANSVFGSGWVFILDDLSVVKTSNAGIPNGNPIMCLDVWEHTYYLDYKYNRKEFIDIFIYHLMNWDLVNINDVFLI